MTDKKSRYTVRMPKTIDLRIEVELDDGGNPCGIRSDAIDTRWIERPVTWAAIAEQAMYQSFNTEEYIGNARIEVDGEPVEYLGPKAMLALAERAGRRAQALIDSIRADNRKADTAEDATC